MLLGAETGVKVGVRRDRLKLQVANLGALWRVCLFFRCEYAISLSCVVSYLEDLAEMLTVSAAKARSTKLCLAVKEEETMMMDVERVGKR